MTEQKQVHGGDRVGFEIEYDRKPMDFSTNVNPAGISEKVCLAIADAAVKAFRYPDPLCRELRARISEKEGVPDDCIFCGNGAVDIIYRLAEVIGASSGLSDGDWKSGDRRVLVTAPTFSEYESAFAEKGIDVIRHMLHEEKKFRIDLSILEQIKDDACAVFLCEPNNPTGVTSDMNLLLQIINKCREANAFLIVDECFNGFLEKPEEHTLKNQLHKYNKLIILKAFTKVHGMAGVRLGYCLCSDRKLIQSLYGAGPPWNVSYLAQAAGIAALKDKNHVKKGRAIIREERRYLQEELHKLGINEIYGEANYILFKSRADLGNRLRSRGIMIRNCDNYHGLDEGWFRVAIKTHEENEKLVEGIRAEVK